MKKELLMKKGQDVVIFSPCVFTRFGLAGLFDAMPGRHLLACVATLPGALGALLTCKPVDMLMLHVTALISEDDWWRFDTAFSLWDLPCHVVILVDTECASVLERMPALTARADSVLGTAVTQRELAACLEGAMTDRGLRH